MHGHEWESNAVEIKHCLSVNLILCENYVCTKRIAPVKGHLALSSLKTSPLNCKNLSWFVQNVLLSCFDHSIYSNLLQMKSHLHFRL